MAFTPRKAPELRTSIDKRIDKLNAKLQIEREQKVFKNPDDFGLRYMKRTFSQKRRAMQEQNHRCPICTYDLGLNNGNHIDDYNPKTNEPRAIICKSCSKTLKRTKGSNYLRKDFLDYLAKYT